VAQDGVFSVSSGFVCFLWFLVCVFLWLLVGYCYALLCGAAVFVVNMGLLTGVHLWLCVSLCRKTSCVVRSFCSAQRSDF